MDAFLANVEATALAAWLRRSFWAYPLVNAGHVLGLALLFGAIAPLDLRLAGCWRGVPLAGLTRVLRPVAAFGLLLAVTTGTLLFSVRATEYAALGLFRVKLALVALGTLNALALGGRLEGAARARRRAVGLLSLGVWAAVIVCGRMLGYV